MTAVVAPHVKPAPQATTFGWSALVVAFLGGSLLAWALEGRTPDHLQLAVCLLTSLAWMFARADASVVALVGATALAGVSLLDPATAATPLVHLGDDSTVLIIAAFILAKAVERSGLAHAIADRLTGARSRAAYGRLATGVFATTFLIPSTAARAGVLVPLVDRAKSRVAGPRGRPAVALMAPLVVVLGAFASPVAAGANLLAIQILAAQSGTSLSFADWTMLALPFAVVMVAGAVVVSWWVAPSADAAPAEPPDVEAAAPGVTAPAAARLRVAGVLVLVVALWSTAAWHPVEPMLVAVLAAVLVTLPNVGVLTLQDGLKSVDWTLIVLLAGATYISDVLAQNPLVADAVTTLETVIGGVDGAWAGPLVVAVLALTAMLSHVAVTSRSARAALLLPPALAIGGAAGVDPTVIALTIASATGFCILTPVGSKALVIFAGSDRQAFSRAALGRAGLLLLPVQFALTLLFALVVWPFILGSV